MQTINNGSVNVIDIEGVIGVAEEEQFREAGERISTYDKLRKRIDGIAEGEIVVNIRSTGGDVNNALLIHDALAGSGRTVTTRCYGYVASAATIIAQAASKGRREISANSLYLIHNSTGGNEGNAIELSQTVSLLRETDMRIAAIYASRSGKKEEKFLALMDENSGNGRWLSPRETIKAALADRIIEAAPIAGNAAEVVRNLGLPDTPQNQNHTIMKISQRWMSFLEILGLAQEAQPLTENNLDVLNDELLSRADKITQLRNRIVELESQTAKLLAKPTLIAQHEDPAIGETAISENESAYSLDAKSISK